MGYALGRVSEKVIRDGLQHLARKEYEPAAQAFREVLELHVDHAEALHGLGVALDAMARYGEALEHLERARARAPHTIQYVQSVACTLLHLGRAADALPLVESVVAERPDFEAYGNLGCVLARLGRVDDAIDAIERGLAAAPTMVHMIADDPDLRVLHRHPRFARLVGLDVSLASQAWQTWLEQPSRVFADACYRLLASTDPSERPASLIAEVTSLIRTSDSEPGRGCAADGALMHWASEFGDVLFHDLTWLRTRLTERDEVEALDLLRALMTLRYDDKLRDRARELAMSESAAIRGRIVDTATHADTSVGIEALMGIVRELRMVEARDEVRALLTELGRRPERVDYLVAYVLPTLAVVANPSDLDELLVWRDDRRPLVRNALAVALGAFGRSAEAERHSTSQTRQILHDALAADEHWIRDSAVVALGALGAAESIGPLQEAYRRESEWNVKLAIAEAVALSGDDRVVPLLLELSTDGNASVVLAAFRGLRCFPLDARARDILRRREHDPNPLIRRAAVEMLRVGAD